MKLKLSLAFIGASILLTSCPTPIPLPSNYAYIASKSSELWLIDLTGNNQDRKIGTFKDNSGSTKTMLDIAWNGTELFGFDSNNAFSKINVQNAAITSIGNIGVELNALGVDGTGQIWGAGSNNLYRINSLTGLGTLIGNTGVTASGDLIFSETGDLFLSTTGNPSDQLVKLNTTNGQSTPIGSMGRTSVLGMYRVGSTTYAATESGELLTVNLMTGATTFVRNLPATVYGMNVKNTAN